MPAAATRAESLRLKIEGEILGGELKPGQKLDEEVLSGRFGLSRTPVREALKALQSTGLVELRPHQGAFVASPTFQSVIEMFEVMALLEVSCAELACRRYDEHDQKRIFAVQAECERSSTATNPAKFYDANVLFHQVIYRAAHNEFLWSQAVQLDRRLEPYRRRITFRPGTTDKSNAEHRAIVDAILQRDAKRARRAMQSHLSALSDEIAVLLRSIPRT